MVAIYNRAASVAAHSVGNPHATMNQYSLFFLDDRNAIQARHDFRTEDDAEAMTIAALLCEACSDVCAGYELWNASRLIMSSRNRMNINGGVPTFDEVTVERQRAIIWHEESVQRSQWQLSRSKKLLALIGRFGEERRQAVEKDD